MKIDLASTNPLAPVIQCTVVAPVPNPPHQPVTEHLNMKVLINFIKNMENPHLFEPNQNMHSIIKVNCNHKLRSIKWTNKAGKAFKNIIRFSMTFKPITKTILIQQQSEMAKHAI